MHATARFRRMARKSPIYEGMAKTRKSGFLSALGEQQRKVIGQTGGGVEEQLYREVLGNSGEIFGQLVWSPDGSRLAFNPLCVPPWVSRWGCFSRNLRSGNQSR